MDAMSIIKDSLRYTVSDIVQLFVLSVPAIIIILLLVSSIIYFDLDFLVVLSPLYFILGIFLALFYSGLMLNVIRETVNLNDVLPEINLKLFLLDGLKYIIVEFVLVGITGGIILASGRCVANTKNIPAARALAESEEIDDTTLSLYVSSPNQSANSSWKHQINGSLLTSGSALY